MGDLKWNIELNDIAIENGDFVITESLDAQNSNLILITKNCFLQNPTIGVGLNQSFNGNYNDLLLILNEWQSQVLADGAKSANFVINEDNTFIVNAIY